MVVAVAAALLGLVSTPCLAEQPVKHIGVYVHPYYEAAQSPSGRPNVAVGKKYDAVLSSTAREDVVAAREAIRNEPQLVTPMTLMVLAIRLYDMDLRDDAVFWFYVAKNRYATLAHVLDVRAPALAQVEQATRDFAVLAGPIINGYAFCDIDRQQTLSRQALEWVENNPYQALFIPQLPAKPGDRHANLQRGLDALRSAAQQEAAYLSHPENRADLAAARKDNGADTKYCWKS